MKRFNADIRIEAPATAVWQVLSDIGTWPAWTPTVSRVEVDGRPGIGSKVFLVQVRFWGALSLRYLHQELDSLKRRCEQGRPGVGAQRPDRCAAWAANASNGEYRA